MLSNLLTALSRKRRDAADGERGFTLIELLVVVIIIGILAAIAIPVYLGVQNNAKDSAVQSDVVNAKTAAVSLETDSGTLPATVTIGTKGAITDAATTAKWGNAGATVSSNTDDLEYYAGTGSNFCVVGESTTGTYFYATDSLGATKVDAADLPTGCKAAD